MNDTLLVDRAFHLRYRRINENVESDQYVTMTVLQLEKEFGDSEDAKEFINELIKGSLV